MSTGHREARSAVAGTRRGPGRPPIPPDRIVAAALRLVDEEGAEALSMRTLAQALGSGTTTLYRHFENRAELVRHVVDLVFGEAEFDDEALAGLGWQQACQVVAREMFDVLAQHKNVVPLLVEQVATGTNAMVIREKCLAALLGAGFPPELAARAYATLARYVLGFAIQLSGHTDPGEEGASTEGLRDIDPQVFPSIAAVGASLPVSLEDEFNFGLEMLLSGLGVLRHGDS